VVISVPFATAGQSPTIPWRFCTHSPPSLTFTTMNRRLGILTELDAGEQHRRAQKSALIRGLRESAVALTQILPAIILIRADDSKRKRIAEAASRGRFYAHIRLGRWPPTLSYAITRMRTLPPIFLAER